jgi:monoamine oxidase
MNRREFIQTTGLATATSFISPSFSIGKKAASVIILGAGFSGLAAAYQLHKKKKQFLVLESRNRVGGRVFSHVIDESEKLVVELGAEWIGQSHSRLRQLCDELNLTLDNNQFDTHLICNGRYYKNNEWDFSKGWKEKFGLLKKSYFKMSIAEKTKLDQMDWWLYLNNQGCEGFDLAIHELSDSTDFGESIRHVSALAAMSDYARASEKNEMDFKIKGGNATLTKIIVEKIGVEKVKLSHTVAKIIQTKAGVEVICSNGQKFSADKLICTLPTSSIKKIEWLPSLPNEKLEAINGLQYARINKSALLFTKRFWPGENFDLMTDLPAHYFYHATKNQPSSKGALISYTIGDKADVMASQNNDDKLKLVQLSLEREFGNIQTVYEKQVSYHWGTDPYSHGAYATYKPGQYIPIQNTLKKPFLHTHFAGEHLADWQGFMEGAVETGEEAVSHIN